MSSVSETMAPLRHADRFFIGGEWVEPSTGAMIDVTDSATEQLFFSVGEAMEADISRAVTAARQAFDQGPWPRMSHRQRAEYLRAIAAGMRKRSEDLGQIWPRESGALHTIARAQERALPVPSSTQRVLRRARRHISSRRASHADCRCLRPYRAGTGRCRQGDHPVERAPCRI